MFVKSWFQPKNQRACLAVLLALASIFTNCMTSSYADSQSSHHKSDQTTVGGNDALDAYVGTGGLLLPSSYTGSASSRNTISMCLGCTWKYTIYCQSNAQGFCAHATATCGAGKIRYRVWFGRRPNDLKLMGSVCTGRSKPATRREVEAHIKQKAIRYVPPLIPGIAPKNMTLQAVPISVWAGQSSNFSPAPMFLSGRKVYLNAHASWLWEWGDGTRQWSQRSGARYPRDGILHQYRKAGTYLIQVTTVWQAQFRIPEIGTFAASGQIVTQRRTLKMTVKRSKPVLTVP